MIHRIIDIEIDDSDEEETNSIVKTIEKKKKKSEETKAKLNNTEEKVERMIKTINRLITTHIQAMKKSKEELNQIVQNGVCETERGIISQENSHHLIKNRMEKINMLIKAFDTSTLEKEFSETKKKFG